MTRFELDMILNSVPEDEKNAMLAVDDAMDKLYGLRLSRRYGVKVECSPGGDRTKIAIDGVVMGHEEFEEWLYEREFGKRTAERVVLPNEVLFGADELTAEEKETNKNILSALRRRYNHYLSGNDPLGPIIERYPDGSVKVTGINWGRKM